MSRAKYVLAVILTMAILAVASQYSYYSNRPTGGQKYVASPPISAQAPANINYPNPTSQNVTLIGFMKTATLAPACALTEPPCAISDSSLHYIVVNGWNYRLIFPKSMTAPMNGARIIVTGVFVTPSSFHPDLWMPQMYFRGDIYVQTYYYASPYI